MGIFMGRAQREDYSCETKLMDIGGKRWKQEIQEFWKSEAE
jgi:hypothetical protein